MSRISITGSTDGLGLMAAVSLLKDGHQSPCTLATKPGPKKSRTRLPGADAVVIGDLSAIESMRRIAEQVNALGHHDAVIHNAGVGYRRWPGVRSNAVEPGWVPAKMGGAGAPDDLSLAPVTQAWLAAGEDPRTDVTGEYFYHQKVRRSDPAARDPHLQDALLDYCAALTSTPLPDPNRGLRQRPELR